MAFILLKRLSYDEEDEDGNDIVIAPKRKMRAKQRVADEVAAPDVQPAENQAQVPSDKYVFLRTEFRVRPGQCIMTGENINCDFRYINASDQTWVDTNCADSSMLDNLGNSYKPNSCSGCGTYLNPGGSCEQHLKFTYVETKASALDLTFIISARKTTDFVKFVNLPITK